MRPADDDPQWPPYERRHDYLQGRIDVLSERRLQRMERKLEELDGKVDILSGRLYVMIGGLAILSLVVNLLGPPLITALTRGIVT